MRISLFGGLHVEHGGQSVVVSGTMQLAVLFRLAVDGGRTVSVRAIVEDVWGLDAPLNERAALQSVISRLRSQLPPDSIESTAGGYRLAVARDEVDALVFEDLVAAAQAATAPEARRLASTALELWAGEPWIPSENFDWFERDLRADHAVALDLAGAEAAPPRASIPAPLTPLVGRDAELAMISAQLAASRIVTIVGTGGAGKTRLAVETALGFRDAIVVELAPVGPGEVLGAVLAATGRELRTESTPDATGSLERIVEYLFGRDYLIVLDNCEHVIGEAARAAEDLLGALPTLRILATSREPLAIPGEAFVAVGSLPPDQALELFRQRAAAAQGTALESEDAARDVCERLDGLPLAIELAAARLRTMTLEEVRAGLDDRFALLTGGYRTALPRHQTLRAMIDWSWSLLAEEERVALAQLAVFPAGVGADDAACLAAHLGLADTAAFDALVDKSLVQRSRGRYRTLETIREYGLEKLAEEGRTPAAREVQARHENERAQLADGRMRGPQVKDVMAWFDAEEDNIAAALRFATTAPFPEVAVELVSSCAWYWILRDRQDDARTWFAAVTEIAGRVDSVEARVIRLVAPIVERFAAAPAGTDPVELLPDAVRDLAGIAELGIGAGSRDLLQLIPAAISALAKVAHLPDAFLHIEIPRGEDLGLDAWPTATLHAARAGMAQNRGDIAALGIESGLAEELFARQGDLWGIALAKQMRSEWLVAVGRLEEALAMSDAATESLRRISSGLDLAQQQGQTISVLVRLGRLDEARERATAMLAETRTSGNSRALLQGELTAVHVDLQVEDLEAADAKLVVIDDLSAAWPSLPWQLRAMARSAHGQAEVLRGDLDAAEKYLRSAAEAALDSHDQPVMGHVAIGIGALALSRGDIQRALLAVDLSTVLIGAYDGSNPQVIAIEAAAEKAGIGRANAEALTRPKAIEALKVLVTS